MQFPNHHRGYLCTGYRDVIAFSPGVVTDLSGLLHGIPGIRCPASPGEDLLTRNINYF